MTPLCATCPSPLGEPLIAGPGVPASVSVPGQKGGALVLSGRRRDDAAFADMVRQFDACFAGELKEFDLTPATGGRSSASGSGPRWTASRTARPSPAVSRPTWRVWSRARCGPPGERSEPTR